MHRRHFITAGAVTAAAGVLEPRILFASEKPTVVMAENIDYRELVRETITQLGGMARFVKPRDNVVLKPNISWDRSPELGANTNPIVVTTLIELILEAEARSILVFDRPCNDPRMSYQNSGIGPAVEAISDRRVRIMHVEDRHYVNTKIPKGKVLKEWLIHREAVQADCIINVPVAKHHGLTQLTLGLKNNMGFLGGNRGRIHMSISQKLADLATILPTKLTVIDATRIMLRHGPQGGSPDDLRVIHTLVASADPVAVDAVATTLFDKPHDAIDTTVKAHEMGLGEIEPTKMNIIRIS
jgi:uncharacterized protein (DUF362 family)